MAKISNVTLPSGDKYDIRATAIPYGEVDSTSTSTAYTVTVPGITELSDGVCCLIKNGVVTSASGFTLNVNGLGAKPSYSNMATGNDVTPTNPTRDTTIFNINYTMLFIYSSTIVTNGGWICYRGYDANTNTVGYQLRTNSTVMTVTDTARYYKLYFTDADGKQWVPASVNSTNNATSARPVNQRPIDPFGRIVYTSASTNFTAGSNLTAATIWDQYVLALGYSFNRAGDDLELATKTPVYLKCAPQANGSAIMDADEPIVQALPSSEDGKIYIFLGIAYSATNIELVPNHPVYYYKDGAVRLWTNQVAGGTGTVTSVGITAGSGISVSGSPVTTSGNITVGHSNSTTAKTTQAVYPITIDGQGHIVTSGNAVPELFMVNATITHVTNGMPTGGTTDKSAYEIYTAASTGKLPVVKIAMQSVGVVQLVAQLSLTENAGSQGYYAVFTYEDQANNTFQYARLTVTGNDFTLTFLPPYLKSGGADLGGVSLMNSDGSLSLSGTDISNNTTIDITITDGVGDNPNVNLYDTKSPHTALMGPASGSSADYPTFRALVADDIPSHTHTSSQISDFNSAVDARIAAYIATLDASNTSY